MVAALTGYTSARDQADKTGNAAVARRLLQPFLAPDQLDAYIQTMSGIWARGESFHGYAILHILSVTAEGSRAFAHDCDDTSGVWLQYASTGAVVPGSMGVAHENVVTRLELLSGRWMVESQLVEDVPCTP